MAELSFLKKRGQVPTNLSFIQMLQEHSVANGAVGNGLQIGYIEIIAFLEFYPIVLTPLEEWDAKPL